MPSNLDMDALRTFATGVDLGSFAKAAARLGRSPSAISLQLRKLEGQLGRPVVQKQGRGLIPTEAGEMLLGYARTMLTANDAALAAIKEPPLTGWVRLGLPQDFAESPLPRVLARFARSHPAVRVEAHVERDAMLRAELDAGRLDLALVWDATRDDVKGDLLLELPMVWVAPRHGLELSVPPWPLVLFGSPCLFRAAATQALDAQGTAWRVAFSSPGLTGLWAAVAAGLGVTPRTRYGLPASLTALDEHASGLPPLPTLGLRLQRADNPGSPAVDRLASLLREELRDVASG